MRWTGARRSPRPVRTAAGEWPSAWPWPRRRRCWPAARRQVRARLVADALTVYSGQHVQTTQALVTAFEKKTGISVNVRTDDEDVLADQIVTEGSRSPADVFFTENSPPLQYLASKGLLAAGRPLDAGQHARHASTRPTGKWVGVSARVSVMVYNTSLLKPERAADLGHGAGRPASGRARSRIAGGETDFQPIVTSHRPDLRRRRPRCGGSRRSRRTPGATATPTTRRSPREVNRGQVALGVINQYYWYREQAQVGASGMHSAIAYFAPHDVGYVIDVSGAGILQVVEPPGRGPALPRLPDLGEGAGDHRPQRQLRVPDRLGRDDGAARDAVRPAPAERHHHPRARHRGRGDQAAAGGPAAVTAALLGPRSPRRPAPAAAPPRRAAPSSCRSPCCCPLVFLVVAGRPGRLGASCTSSCSGA